MKSGKSLLQAVVEEGHRVTPQRMLVLEAIESSDSHISAEEIYTQVHAKYPYINISTVYRTLELLKKLGLVTETDMGEGILRYHHADKGHHHHLVCQKCGRIIDLDESALDSLRSALIREYHFVPNLRHIAIFGHCLDCQE